MPIGYLVYTLICILVPPKYQKYNGETEEQARNRYATIAHAITLETEDKALMAYLLTAGRHESSFTPQVHSGAKRGDNGKSWGMFQVMCGTHKGAKVPGAKGVVAGDLVGTDLESTRTAVRVSITHLNYHRKRCRRSRRDAISVPRCVFEGYGGVRNPHNPFVKKLIDARMRTFRRIHPLI